MNPIREFGDTAKSLAKNPLGIIALFIVLIYGFASTVVGASDKLQHDERFPIIWFLVIFPIIVLGVFGWLVSQHHEKLYAPRDFKTDESFLKGLARVKEGRPALRELDKQIEEKVRDVLASEELTNNVPNKAELEMLLLGAADKITKGIRNSSFITIDARKLTTSEKDVFELPAGAFSNFGEFTDEVYVLIQNFVRPYEYGYSWILRNSNNGSVFKNARMITKTAAGVPLPDERSLIEVGISAGMILEVAQP